MTPTTAPNSATPFAARSRKPVMDEILHAAGIVIVTGDGNALYLKRGAAGDHEGEWGWPGGKLEQDEDAKTAAIRETREETGWIPDQPIHKLRQHEMDGVDFTAFECKINNEFVPTLDSEHTGWAWAPLDDPPQPLHPGCKKMLDDFLAGLAEDGGPGSGPHERINFASSGAKRGESTSPLKSEPSRQRTPEERAEMKRLFDAEMAAAEKKYGKPKGMNESAGQSTERIGFKSLSKDTAANEWPNAKLQQTGRTSIDPPEHGGENVINHSFSEGGLKRGEKLRENPTAKKYAVTGLTKDSDFKEDETIAQDVSIILSQHAILQAFRSRHTC